MAQGRRRYGKGRRTDRRNRDRQSRGRDRSAVQRDVEYDRSAGRRRSAYGRAHRYHQEIAFFGIGRVSMKILCANWQAADEAELERKHYPDIEFILARSTNERAAELDPSICRVVDAVINYSPTHNVAAAS